MHEYLVIERVVRQLYINPARSANFQEFRRGVEKTAITGWQLLLMAGVYGYVPAK